MRQSKVSLKIWVILSVGNNKGDQIKCSYNTTTFPKLGLLIMSNSAAQFVSFNFANFLLENANNGNEILSVLDDLYEVQSTPL